jgi:putative tricarboxylic transport membrane protein
MAKADIVGGVLLMAFGLLLLGWIIPAQTHQDTGAAVPPALLPQICAIGITILAAILTLNALRGKTPAGKPPMMKEWAAMGAVITIILAGAALFKFVHPAVAGAFVSFATMIYMGERRIHLLILLPAGLVLSIYVLFYELLGTAIL